VDGLATTLASTDSHTQVSIPSIGLEEGFPGARVGKNILIFSDGTGQAGGYMPDETRSNVYKLFRATRVCPDTCIDPEAQIAFYDGGLGSRASEDGIKIKWWRWLYNSLARATGLGITQNIIDCYAAIIRVWQPGDRIYLFGFSRGAYTVRCVAGVLKYCGVPTAVRGHRGQALPLQRDLRSARRLASEAVKRVYQYGSSIKGDPQRAERERRAILFRSKYFSGDSEMSNTAPYFIGAWDTIATLGAGTRGLAALTCAYEVVWLAAAYLVSLAAEWLFWPVLLGFGLGLPAAIYVVGCIRYHGLVSLVRYRMAFYDTRLHYAVRYARHALSIDENRAKFDCIAWHDEGDTRHFMADRERDVPRFKQVWFAGNHSDIGGSYPETESRLSDISLGWMVEEAMCLPHPVRIDHSVLNLFPDHRGEQHDERKALLSACPGWLTRCGVRLIGPKKFGWREGYRNIPRDALLHPSVYRRFALGAVLVHGEMIPYLPHPLRHHQDVGMFWKSREGQNRGAGSGGDRRLHGAVGLPTPRSTSIGSARRQRPSGQRPAAARSSR
jgi:uncharacterized protein (DUF2235 family)